MLNPTFTGPFKKDRKLMIKQNKDMDKLTEVLTMLIKEQPLLPKHENHPLHGKYQGKWECHVEPDWLLIYRIDNENCRITFYRTGSHSDLF
ncbi:MAG: type II toxin-antitoxin system YafQ family toxin [Treponema sp.]|jgi:mRNA interferase YafQ|nr:type II toxin-antitoxin system YafQ family toxin [Treponema sp.]